MTNRHQQTFILAAAILASGMAFLDGSVVNIAVPTIQKGFAATFGNMLWVVNAFPLVLASLLLVSGSLSDRFGRKKIFSLGIIIFAGASVLCGLSGNILQLEIFRALQGLGAAMMIPGSLAIINVNFPENQRGRAIGLWSGFAGGIAAAGPFVGGFLVQHFSWHAIFFINVPLALLALFFTFIAVPESKNPDAKGLDLVGTILISLGLFGLAYGLMSAPGKSWSDPVILTSLIGGAVALIAFGIVENKIKNPLVPLSLFKSKLVLGANLATLLLYSALNGLIFFLVLNMQQVQSLSPTLSGLALLPAILIITFFSGTGGSIADKIGPRKPMIIGPLIVALGMGLIILPGVKANYFISFLPGMILFGLGMALVIAPLTKSALSVPDNFSGAASGANNAVARIAALLSVAVLGAIAVMSFRATLGNHLQQTNLNSYQQQTILSQSAKFGGIIVPDNFTVQDKTAAQTAIKQSFVGAFRFVITLCVILALLASVCSTFFIKPNKP